MKINGIRFSELPKMISLGKALHSCPSMSSFKITWSASIVAWLVHKELADMAEDDFFTNQDFGHSDGINRWKSGLNCESCLKQKDFLL